MPTANAKSRGYQKIAYAADYFHFDFRGKIVLDIGSSTGGFTEFALEHGAKKVIAIEKGTNQMRAPLCLNPRVELYEKTDIFSVFSRDCLVKNGRSTDHIMEKISALATTLIDTPDVVLADVSFISLTEVLSHVSANLSGPYTKFLVMCKPQFEARPEELHHGVVKNSSIRRQIFKRFESWLKSHHFFIMNKCDNKLTGKTGNLERFYLLKKVH